MPCSYPASYRRVVSLVALFSVFVLTLRQHKTHNICINALNSRTQAHVFLPIPCLTNSPCSPSCVAAAGGAMPARALCEHVVGGPRRPQPGGHQREHGDAPGRQHPVQLHRRPAAGARGQHQRPEQGEAALFMHRTEPRLRSSFPGSSHPTGIGRPENVLHPCA